MVIVDEFRWSYSEVMALPYKTFIALQRLVVIRRRSQQSRRPELRE